VLPLPLLQLQLLASWQMPLLVLPAALWPPVQVMPALQWAVCRAAVVAAVALAAAAVTAAAAAVQSQAGRQLHHHHHHLLQQLLLLRDGCHPRHQLLLQLQTPQLPRLAASLASS
jgi:hypothetical protein